MAARRGRYASSILHGAVPRLRANGEISYRRCARDVQKWSKAKVLEGVRRRTLREGVVLGCDLLLEKIRFEIEKTSG